MRYLLTIAVLICVSLNAENVRRPITLPPYAGNESGAGGHGIVNGQDLQFYDFVEMGVAEKPYYDLTLTSHPAYTNLHNKLKLALNGALEPNSLKILTVKFLELHRSSEDLAYNIVAGLEKMQWDVVNEEVFRALLHNPALEVDSSRLRTVGFRQGLHVRFNRTHLTKFPVAHRAGIVIHEVLSAFVPPTQTSDFIQARTLTGFLFSERIKNKEQLARQAAYFRPKGIAVPIDLMGSEQYVGYNMDVVSQENSAECKRIFSRSVPLLRNSTPESFANSACPDPEDYRHWIQCRPLPYFYRSEATVTVNQKLMPDRSLVDYLRVDTVPGVYTMLEILGHQSPRLQVNGHCRAFAKKVHEFFFKDYRIKGILEANDVFP